MTPRGRRTESFSFRFIGATTGLIDSLYAIYDHSLLTLHPYYKDNNLQVLTIELYRDIDYSKLIRLVNELKIDKKQCGIYLYLITDRDSDGIVVPDFVIDIYKEIGHTIDISFSCSC